MQRLISRLVVCVTLIAPAGATVLAHGGHDHKVMGTVTSTSASQVVVKEKDGKTVTIQVTPETRIKSTPALKVEQITPGTRVVVTAAVAKDNSMRATLVEVGATAAPATTATAKPAAAKPAAAKPAAAK
jgi:hypothetical protein